MLVEDAGDSWAWPCQVDPRTSVLERDMTPRGSWVCRVGWGWVEPRTELGLRGVGVVEWDWWSGGVAVRERAWDLSAKGCSRCKKTRTMLSL